ncbi:MAG: TatD family hydrolase [Anaerolineaceae bacterium]|nr:TatD family hydrolase [Anaerolineaceae bacterium]
MDSHCHLDFGAFDSDRMEVLERSRAAGVTRWLNPGVDLPSSRRGLILADKIPGLYCAIGVHPTHSPVEVESEIRELAKLVALPKVLAIGEIGLDNHHKDTLPADQERRFQAQLDLARKMKIPVIIHSRNAMQATLRLLASWVDELTQENSSLLHRPGVLHAFDGNIEEAGRAMELGFFLGVGGPVTYLNANERRKVFSALPLDHLLTETDAPFLSPQPFRGQRNEPAYILLIAKMLASIHNTTVDDIALITSNNAARLFAWREMIE